MTCLNKILQKNLRGCISAQLCAHFFIICTFSPLRTIINDASRKITSQISSFRTFPRSDVFRKIWEASLELPDFRELERGLTPNLGSSVARSNFFMHTVARKNCQIYYVPTYRKFKYCTAKISSKYLTVIFNYSVLPKYIFTHCWGVMGICDVPALRALIQKRLPFFKKREKWELGGYETGSANTAPEQNHTRFVWSLGGNHGKLYDFDDCWYTNDNIIQGLYDEIPVKNNQRIA